MYIWFVIKKCMYSVLDTFITCVNLISQEYTLPCSIFIYYPIYPGKGVEKIYYLLHVAEFSLFLGTMLFGRFAPPSQFIY